MRRIAPWTGKVLLDCGAGTGFHIERFHHEAAQVVAVEPDPDLRLALMQRIVDRRLTRTSVLGASAESMPLRDHSVDIGHARFAYFFGPGCEPGLAELRRILRPGGTAFIIDNDLRRGTFAAWVRAPISSRTTPSPPLSASGAHRDLRSSTSRPAGASRIARRLSAWSTSNSRSATSPHS